jgi:hypothetical protein
MSEYTKIGSIISCVEKETNNNKLYKKIAIMPENEIEVIETNAFENKVNLDLIEEGRSYTFYLEKNGQYTNLNKISEVPDGKQLTLTEEQKKKATSTHYDNIINKTIKKEEDDYIMLNGKKYTTHKGLLNNAYKKGLKSIITDFISYENDTAVMKSTVTMADDTVFTSYGDANPSNVNYNIAKHLIRMAETRATNRALRLATNQAETSIEELGGVNNEQSK